ncbi:hypothetical protein ABT084_03735 [Streptomyces sp. NPDC002138]|uniref:hypothetical protein n=1 Tax=Streptomyces sp. NPDC002138 TaxID=3154410 RepID=UPI00331BC5A9
MRTIAAIEAAGFTVDLDLWRGPRDSLVSVAAECPHSDDDRGPIVIIPKKPKGWAPRMTEWTDPRYADIVARLRAQREQPEQPDRRGPQPVRGFIVPATDET